MARCVCAVGVVVPGAGQVIVCHGHHMGRVCPQCPAPDLPPDTALTRPSAPTFFSRCCPGKTDLGWFGELDDGWNVRRL